MEVREPDMEGNPGSSRGEALGAQTTRGFAGCHGGRGWEKRWRRELRQSGWGGHWVEGGMGTRNLLCPGQDFGIDSGPDAGKAMGWPSALWLGAQLTRPGPPLAGSAVSPCGLLRLWGGGPRTRASGPSSFVLSFFRHHHLRIFFSFIFIERIEKAQPARLSG